MIHSSESAGRARESRTATARRMRCTSLWCGVVLGFFLMIPLQAAAQTIAMSARALRYDAQTSLLYALVASNGAGLYGDRLVAISPALGTVVASLDLGAGASSLAISPDVARAYIGYKTGHVVRQVDLATMTVGVSFPVGATLYVQDLAVMPGSPDTVAVALAMSEGSACSRVTVYHGGVEGSGAEQPGCDAIAFGDDPGFLYAYDRLSTGAWLVRDAISTSAVVLDDGVLRGLPAFARSFRVRGGTVYSGSGVAVDGATLHPVGRYAAQGPFAFDDAHGVVAYFEDADFSNDAHVRVFDRESFVLLRAIALEVPPGSRALHASECGSNCAAVAFDSGQVVLVTTLVDAVFSDGFDGMPRAAEERP